MSTPGGPPSGELPSAPKPEVLASKTPDTKPPEAQQLGEPEEKIVTRIIKDGNPDLVLEDIAGTSEPQDGKIPPQKAKDGEPTQPQPDEAGPSEKPDSETRGASEVLTADMQSREDRYLQQFIQTAQKEVDEIQKQIDMLSKKSAESPDDKSRTQIEELRRKKQIAEAKRDGLKTRYDDRAHKEAVQAEIKKFAQDRGVNLDEIPQELATISFESDTNGQTEAAALRLAEKFFNSEQASRNPEKYAMVEKQTKEYLKLLRQAQAEGSIPKEVTASYAYRLVAENIAAVAAQDRAASENLLGDHGVRHLVGHNIEASMQIAESLRNRGTSITAMDKLLMHQIMIYHDLGYAMAPVRDAINQQGIRGQDAAHNLLSAQYVRERIADSSDVWHAVFGKNQQNLDIFHRGILYHDKDESGGAGIRFITKLKEGENPRQARAVNIESIIRTADNTHAFEDKLPELLYRYPETIKYMRLMKTAGEIGDKAAFLQLRRELAGKINASDQLSLDDKDALTLAVLGQDNIDGNDPKKGLQAEGYKFTVGRICGNKPEFAMLEDDRLSITVQESAIHQEAVGLFGQESYDQLRKFLADLKGVNKDQVSLDQPEIEAGSLVIKLRTGEQKAQTATDYQQRISEIRQADPAFVEFANQDIGLSLEQLALEKSLKLASEGRIDQLKLGELLSPFITAKEPDTDIMQLAQTRVTAIKQDRKQLLAKYRSPVS